MLIFSGVVKELSVLSEILPDEIGCLFVTLYFVKLQDETHVKSSFLGILFQTGEGHQRLIDLVAVEDDEFLDRIYWPRLFFDLLFNHFQFGNFNKIFPTGFRV